MCFNISGGQLSKNLNNCCKISFKSVRNGLFITVHDFKKIWVVQEIESKISLLYGEMTGSYIYTAILYILNV